MKTFFTTLRLKNPAAGPALQQELLRLQELSKSEAGMVRYEVLRDDADELLYYVLDSWSNEDTLQQHMAQPHIQQFAGLSYPLLMEPLSTLALKSVGDD